MYLYMCVYVSRTLHRYDMPVACQVFIVELKWFTGNHIFQNNTKKTFFIPR